MGTEPSRRLYVAHDWVLTSDGHLQFYAPNSTVIYMINSRYWISVKAEDHLQDAKPEDWTTASLLERQRSTE